MQHLQPIGRWAYAKRAGKIGHVPIHLRAEIDDDWLGCLEPPIRRTAVRHRTVRSGPDNHWKGQTVRASLTEPSLNSPRDFKLCEARAHPAWQFGIHTVGEQGRTPDCAELIRVLD